MDCFLVGPGIAEEVLVAKAFVAAGTVVAIVEEALVVVEVSVLVESEAVHVVVVPAIAFVAVATGLVGFAIALEAHAAVAISAEPPGVLRSAAFSFSPAPLHQLHSQDQYS